MQYEEWLEQQKTPLASADSEEGIHFRLGTKEAWDIAATQGEFEGTIYRGQRWIELHGRFTPERLRELAQDVEAKCNGVPARPVC